GMQARRHTLDLVLMIGLRYPFIAARRSLLQPIAGECMPTQILKHLQSITLACKPSPRGQPGIIAMAGRISVARRVRDACSANLDRPVLDMPVLDMPVLERSMIGIARNALFALVACLICFEPLAAQAPAVIDTAPASGARIEAVAARHGMVAAQEARAARIGVEVLEQGGNAVDAAVATGFALAVTYPRAGN